MPNLILPNERKFRQYKLSSNVLSRFFVDLEVDSGTKSLASFNRGIAGELTFVSGEHDGGAVRIIRSEHLLHESNDNDFFIGINIEGQIRTIQNGQVAEVQQGDMVVLDASRSYSIEHGISGKTLWVKVPRHFFTSRFLNIDYYMSQAISCQSGIPFVAVKTLIACNEVINDLNDFSANQLQKSAIDIVSSALNCYFKPQQNCTSNNQKLTLQNIENFVEENLMNEDLTIEMVSKQMKLSTRYISKIFQQKGITFCNWIMKRRMEICRQLLLDPVEASNTIKEIAYGCGFSNISHFNRTFKQYYNQTPTDFRKTLFKAHN